ncbi:MAG: hypothetical protein DI565_16150 [Ancylobacter novellus]|uniref:Uncharacterized protein n=1 Tax=Ancylobacter novellus TaxID=921 RepID=A0A2W5MG37_ANCNO|nr:MAG: hypothetical protein DI565_16150 [Ancylobacter novellus]
MRKLISPTRRRARDDRVMEKVDVTERRAFIVLCCIDQRSQKVPTRPDNEARLTADIASLVVEYGRYG